MKIEFHFSFIILLLLAYLSGNIRSVLILFWCLIIHEFGHIIFCFLFKRHINKITIFYVGGILEYDEHKNTFLHEDFLISAGGIIFNSVLILYGLIIKNMELIQYNKLIILMNILPILPLDGGRMLLVIMNKFFSYQRSLKITQIISITIIFGLLVYYVFLLNINFVVVFLTLFIENIDQFRKKNKVLNNFYLKKYLYPNDKMRVRVHKKKPEVSNIYKGVNNIYNYQKRLISEKTILKHFFTK